MRRRDDSDFEPDNTRQHNSLDVLSQRIRDRLDHHGTRSRGWNAIHSGVDEAGPVVVFGDGGLLVVRRAGPLVVHLKEEKIGELLDVVAVGNPVIAEKIAIVPNFADEIGGGGRHQGIRLWAFSSWAGC